MITGAQIQTLTIVSGTMVCNAQCPDCVAQMTTPPEARRAIGYRGIDTANLAIASNMAIASGASTILFTGKGEPSLFPEQVDDYLKFFQDPIYSQLALKEMQSNGLLFHHPDFTGPSGDNESGWLQQWYDRGLRVMSLSVVDVEDEPNRTFLTPRWKKYPPLVETVNILHDIGYTVRINITMMGNYICDPEGLERVIEFCKSHAIEQLSMRPVRKTWNKPANSKALEVWSWVDENELTPQQEEDLVSYVTNHDDSRLLRNLVHGARIYNFKGQNLCLTDCLTIDTDAESAIRQLIFFSGGLVTWDWQNPATIILGWGPDARAFTASKGPQYDSYTMATVREYLGSGSNL